MTHSNPYNYNLPVDANMFFGRHQMVEAITRDLIVNPGDSIALTGGRRMGKTSLLEMIFQALKGETRKMASDILVLPLFLDFTGEGINSTHSFFRTIGEKALLLLAKFVNTSPNPFPNLTENQAPAPVFRSILEQWNQIVMLEQGYALRLIILLDECEQIVKQPWAAELYGALRFLLVGRSTRPLFKVVMAGSHRFLTQVRQHGSPLRNVLAYHNLQVLDTPSTYDLINKPSGNILSIETTNFIATQSGGHPFLTQYIMHHLWNLGIENTTSQTVQPILNMFPHQRNDFWDWLNNLGNSSIKTYHILAQNTDLVAERDIRTAFNSPPTNLLQALDALCYHGLIIQQEQKGEMYYQIAGQMFCDWFLANIADNNMLNLQPNLNDLRQKLNQMFDDSNLDAFCLDYFTEVFNQFNRGMRKDEKINLLLDYCRRIPKRYQKLLTTIKRIN